MQFFLSAFLKKETWLLFTQFQGIKSTVVSKLHSNDVILYFLETGKDHVLAVFCGRFIITVNRDNLYAQKQCKLASVCLQ